MKQNGIIRSEWREPAPANRRQRRVYSITGKGLQELDQRIQAWQVFNLAMMDLTGVGTAT